LQLDWSFQSPQAAELLELELPPERLFRFFARTLRGARHQLGCRCISSYLETHIGLIDQSQQAQFLNRTESILKSKWLMASTKAVAPLLSHAPRLPPRKSAGRRAY
jgi:hypothetical protein